MNFMLNKIYIITILNIICGLALFLTGIKLMSAAFEKVLSYKLKIMINKFTSNKINGVIIGIIMTSLLHSSSAATIIVISLVHGNLLNIYNAVPIIMGSNIGTTLTAQLVAFKVDNIYIYLFLVNIILFPLLWKSKYRSILKVLFGLSLIFAGMEVISYSMSHIKSNKVFFDLIRYLSKSKFMSLFAGFILTAVIQSSTTGITIVQIMASSQIISLSAAIPIVLGQNIGTCVDTVIGSLATNRAGKQVALVHVLFNVLGVIIFYFFTDFLYSFVIRISPANPSRQIANVHSFFNIVTTIILLPFSSVILNLSQKIIKE